MTEIARLRFVDLPVGLEHHEDYVCTAEVHSGFLATFDDRSPIHVSRDHAVAQGFSGRVVHGAILNGFLSHFVGMRFPGRHALLLSCDVRYARPTYLDDRIRLHARVEQRLESEHVVVLTVRFENVTRGEDAARGRVQIKLLGG